MTALIKRALAKNRNVRAPALPFKVPIDANIDEDYCSATSEAMAACTTGWHRLEVTSNLEAYIPNKPGLYLFMWRSCLSLKGAANEPDQLFDWCIYVGKAEKSLKSRFRSEYKAHIDGGPEGLWSRNISGRNQILKTYLTLRPLYYMYTTTIEVDRISDMEDRLIDILSPPLNDLGKIRATFAKAPEPAF